MRKLTLGNFADHVWSFSAITSFVQCPRSFQYKYIDGREQVGNGFADFGTLFHSVLEAYAAKEIRADELLDAFEALYPGAVTNPYPSYPAKMKERQYERGKAFFASFQGYDPAYKVIAVEHRMTGEVNGRKFTGITDLALEDKDGAVTIIDIKTKSLASMRKEKELYKKQLLLYAKLWSLEQPDGALPRSCGFLLPESDGFDLFEVTAHEVEAACDWAENIILDIYATMLLGDEFPLSPSNYFCENICGFRNVCPHIVGE